MSILSPQKTRLLNCLITKPHTSRELMIEVGCNNPPDIVQLLRKKQFIDIQCDDIPSTNRDGKIIYIGLYSIPKNEREKVLKLLEATAIAPSDDISNIAKSTNNEGNDNTDKE
jgi:hypothetical protein